MTEDRKRLEEVRSLLGLSSDELAAMLGVPAESIAQRGVIGTHEHIHETLEIVHGITQILAVHIRQDRLSAVVRRNDAWLGDRSILEVLTCDPVHGADEIWDYLDRLFSYIPE